MTRPYVTRVHGSDIVSVPFGGHATKDILRVVGSKRRPVLNFVQQHVTPNNALDFFMDTELILPLGAIPT